MLTPGGLLISKTPCLAEMSPLIRLAVPVMWAIGKAPYVSFFSGPQLEQEIASMGFESSSGRGTGPGAGMPGYSSWRVSPNSASGSVIDVALLATGLGM